jgi:rRNA maturation protein Nop10
MFNPEIEIINIKSIGDQRLSVCQNCSQYQANQTCLVSGHVMTVKVYELAEQCPEQRW